LDGIPLLLHKEVKKLNAAAGYRSDLRDYQILIVVSLSIHFIVLYLCSGLETGNGSICYSDHPDMQLENPKIATNGNQKRTVLRSGT
jgi:hypothetical protein